MGRSQISRSQVLLGALSVWLTACGLDSDLLDRSGSAAPVTTGVILSGAGARDDGEATVGNGDSSRITNIGGTSGDDSSRRASAVSTPGGTESGGAFAERAGDTGGAAGAGGAAGVGGTNENDESAGSSAKEPPALWFSEYIEGSSSNKALEISARTHSVLDGCRVGTYFNGKNEATVVATLSGVLEAGQVLTLCTSALKEKLAAVCDQVGNLTFNGDDVVALSCDGVILDVIGQIGVDPGVAWGSEPSTTADHTLRRKCGVLSGDSLGTDAFEPRTEWLAFPVDTFDGLGAHGC
jgi:hypothetical protein